MMKPAPKMILATSGGGVARKLRASAVVYVSILRRSASQGDKTPR